MRLPLATTAVAALAIALSAGGVAGASTTGNQTSVAPARTATTVHTARAVVGGMTETILVNARGLPLYTYQPDTATTSMVTGELAALWPPFVDSKLPTAKGVTGKLTVVKTQDRRQVAYQGHFLYTFAEDTTGHVTGQGVQSFFVATPGIAKERAASSTAGSNSTSTPSTSSSSSNNNPYGY